MKKIKNVLASSLIFSAAFATAGAANAQAVEVINSPTITTPAVNAVMNTLTPIMPAPKAQDPAAVEAEINALMREGKLEQALNRVDAFLAVQQDPNLSFQKGVILSLLNRVDDAIGVFTKMTEMYPNIAEPYNNLGILYVTKKDWLRARSAFETAIQNRPDYPNALDNLGDLYVKLAANAYQKNIALDAKNMVATSKLNLLNPIIALPVGARKVVGGSEMVNNTNSASNSSATSVGSNPKTAVKATEKSTAKAAKTTPATTAPAVATTEKATIKPDAKSALKPEVKTNDKTDVKADAKATVKTDVKPAAAPQITAEQASVLGVVNNWAKAWSQKNASGYLAAYSDSFKPANMTLADWKEDRKQKITNKGHIKVMLSNPDVVVGQQQATVKFVQNYESDKLKDVSQKTLVLIKKNGTWLIDKELTQ